MRLLLIFIFLMIASGCVSRPVPGTTVSVLSADAPVCAAFFDELERQIADANALNAGAVRIPGYPFLRTNRLLASLAPSAVDPAHARALIEHLRTLDMSYRRHEIAVMGGADVADITRRAESCSRTLTEALLASADNVERLLAAITVPDHYVDSRRVVGAYPLIRPFMKAGVMRWQREARDAFSNERPLVPTRRYWPTKTAAVSVSFPLPTDALGIPQYSPMQENALFARHAPVFEVASAAHDDRIGAVSIEQGRAGIDTASPTVYQGISFTRFDGDVLLQLNYVVWFPARTKTGPLDLYGGRFDGLDVRVTLDTDGAPLLYETIHNCGCYYKAYITSRIKARTDIPFAEPPLIFRAPAVPADSRLVVSMTPTAHYVNHLYVERMANRRHDAASYFSRPYATLFSLPAPEGKRSFFDQRGLVPGSERLEGYLLWPSGVPAPGAMRQWGTHAIAFIGERHFDDAAMLDMMFMRTR